MDWLQYVLIFKFVLKPIIQFDENDLQWSNDERRENDEFAETVIPYAVALKESEEMKKKMNSEQKDAFETIINSAQDPDGQRLFFLEVKLYSMIDLTIENTQGAGGTGKTFLYKALYYECILLGLKVLTFLKN